MRIIDNALRHLEDASTAGGQILVAVALSYLACHVLAWPITPGQP